VGFGAFAEVNCAMHPDLQPLLRSTDGGATWRQPGLPSQVDVCGGAELAMTPSGEELLVAPSTPYPLLGSADGGATWADIGLPPLPDQPAGQGFGVQLGGATLLPDGSLLDVGVEPTWELLRAGAQAWCPVRGAPPSTAVMSQIVVIGPRLWWIAGGTAPTAQSRDLAGIAC